MRRLSLKQSVLGIGLISLASLMFEILVNKALGYSTWGSLGYMIIGSAIFGFSIAGVLIAIWKPHLKYPVDSLIAIASIILTISILFCYVIMNIFPFRFNALVAEIASQTIYLSVWYLSLLIPFTMTGFIIALLLMHFKDHCNRLYAADLIGAGLGCLLVTPLFPLFGAAGLYYICAVFAGLGALVFSYRLSTRYRVISVVLIVTSLAFSPYAQTVYPVIAHHSKRARGEHMDAGAIKHSMWSFLSKIEVALPDDKPNGMIWFDGGMMESGVDRFDGDYQNAKTDYWINGANSIPYRIRNRGDVLIIAPAGGREVRAALTWGAQKVTGVELDYSVVKLVKKELDGYLGGIYTNPKVKLVNDEGRSFVRRSKEKYDVIQFISAYSVTAVQSGAIDLSSSYLMTIEAFNDYFDHLTDDGVLSVSQDYNVRLFTTGWTALEQRGLDPRDHIILIKNAYGTLGRNTLLAKLTPFNPSELDIIQAICTEQKMAINYAPEYLMRKVDTVHGLISEPKTRLLLNTYVETIKKDRNDFYNRLPYKVWPVSDNSPFFGNIRYMFLDLRKFPELLTEEIEAGTQHTLYMPMISLGVIPRLIILGQGIIFALLFLIFPLWKMKSEGVATGAQRMSMLYFLALGFGFIWIEIVLLKKFILFLGNPVYSIAIVLFAMLTSAGIGSYFSEKLSNSLPRRLILVAIALFVSVIITMFVYPVIFEKYLGLPFAWRILLTFAMIAPVGFIMGMPFPIGLDLLSKYSPESIPWAWAMNGYATVIGVSTCVLLSQQTGFFLILSFAFGIYIIGFVGLGVADRLFCKQAQNIERVKLKGTQETVEAI